MSKTAYFIQEQTNGDLYLHDPNRYSDEHHDEKVLIVVVNAWVVTLKLENAGVEINGLNRLENDGEIIRPSDSNSENSKREIKSSRKKTRNAVKKCKTGGAQTCLEWSKPENIEHCW